MTQSTLNLDEELKAAINELQGRSVMLETAYKLSKKALDDKVNYYIDLINKGSLTGKELKQATVEARILAILRMRRE